MTTLKRSDAAQRFAADVIVRVMRLCLDHPWQVAITAVATLAAAQFQLMIPQYLGDAVDHAHSLLAAGPGTAAAARAALAEAAVMIVTVGALRGLFTMLHNYFGEAIGHCVGYRLRLAFYEKLQRSSFGFHDRVHTGDLITRGMLDLEGVRMFFSTGPVRVLLLGYLIGVGAWLLVRADPALAMLALSFVPFVAWRSSVARLRLRLLWLLLQEKLSDLSRVMDENLCGIRVVRAFAAAQYEMAKFDTIAVEAIAVAEERVDVRVRNTTAMTFSFLAAMGLVLWVGGLKVIAGEITVGTLAEFLTFMTILQMPVRQIGLMVNSFARTSTCGQRLFEVLDQEATVRDRPGARPLDVTEGVLRFEDVSFAYVDGHPALHGVSFRVGPGQTLGIVGPPGSGKSTIAHLIPRFYDVAGGRVTIDGEDVRDVSLDSLRQAVGVVQQDSFLFTTSIENNVAYGDPWAADERIARANRTAQLHDYVCSLPLGYGTLVGERGVSLSGGQRQRLSIARSLLPGPRFLIFDDSTAAIDADTEQRMRVALREGVDSRATIIISHRLNSLMHADEILVLEAGRVVERGTHEVLLALGGRYRALYELQLRPEDDAEPSMGGSV